MTGPFLCVSDVAADHVALELLEGYCFPEGRLESFAHSHRGVKLWHNRNLNSIAGTLEAPRSRKVGRGLHSGVSDWQWGGNDNEGRFRLRLLYSEKEE